MSIALHWVARTVRPSLPFLSDEIAAKNWLRLEEFFPDAVASVLMPNHVHLILPTENATPDRKSSIFGAWMSAASRSDGVLWEPMPEPRPIPNLSHLKVQLRYVYLNPCRAQLTRDPLNWLWSSYRDLFDCTLTGRRAFHWLRKRLAGEFLGVRSERDFLEAWHRYVSSDPSVREDGSVLPNTVAPHWAEVAFSDIAGAVLAAHRAPVCALQSKGRVRQHLLYRLHEFSIGGLRQIARDLAVTANTAYQAKHFVPTLQEQNAFQRCLAEERLRPPSREWLESLIKNIGCPPVGPPGQCCSVYRFRHGGGG